MGSSDDSSGPGGGVTVGVLTIESVMLVHDWHNRCTCRLTVLSSRIRKLHAGQGQGAVRIRLAAGSDIYDKKLIAIKK